MSLPGAFTTQTRIEASQRAFLRVTAKEYLTLEDAFEAVGAFADFLMLTSRAATYPLLFKFRPYAPREGDVTASVSVLFQSNYYGSKGMPLDRHLMLFPLDRFANIQETFSKWLLFGEGASSVVNRFTANLLNPSMYIESRFLNAIQAVEQIYGRLFKVEDMTPEEFELRVDFFCAPFDGDDAMWLRQVLADANKRPLRKKLVELIRLTRPASSAYFPNSARTQRFAADASELRNRLSHGEAYDDLKLNLFDLTQRTTRLIEILLLRQAGLSLSRIDEESKRLAWRDLWNQ